MALWESHEKCGPLTGPWEKPNNPALSTQLTGTISVWSDKSMASEPTHNSSPGGACEDARFPALPLADELALKGGGTCEEARSLPLPLAE